MPEEGPVRRPGDEMSAGAKTTSGTVLESPGPGAAHVHDESFSANRRYEGSKKHGRADRRVGGRKVSKEPTDGEAALDFSFQVSDSAPTRVGVDVKNNEFVVFNRTGNLVEDKQPAGGVYHGHVRTWSELDRDMQRVLVENHMVDKKGRIQVDPARWEDKP
jgi:hypothetical protein